MPVIKPNNHISGCHQNIHLYIALFVSWGTSHSNSYKSHFFSAAQCIHVTVRVSWESERQLYRAGQLHHQEPCQKQRWNNQPCHTSPNEKAVSKIIIKKKMKERIHHYWRDAPNLSAPPSRPSLLSNRTPAAGSMSRTTLPDVLPATSPCHQGENWSHLKFRVTSSDWSLGSQHAGWMAGLEMGKLKLINK